MSDDETRPLALHVHLDSCWTYLQHLTTEVDRSRADPAYTRMMPRIVEWAAGRGARLTIFVVGADLLVEEHAALVRAWRDEGHEIGNHSWSHPPQLASLDDDAIVAEVTRAHDVITRTLGAPPTGFTAPGWYADERIYPVLRDLGYRYDCSLFPSWFMMIQPLVVRHLSPAVRNKIRRLRRDWRAVMFGSSTMHRRADNRGLWVGPVPVATMRLPYWHTMAFTLPAWLSRSLMRSAMSRRPLDYFHVVHPMDLLDADADLPGGALTYLRSQVPYARKRAVWDRVMSELDGRPIVPMSNLLSTASGASTIEPARA